MSTQHTAAPTDAQNGTPNATAETQAAKVTATGLPDFAALFPLDEGSDQEGWRLTPRTAEELWNILRTLSEEAEQDADILGDLPVKVPSDGTWGTFELLPPLTWGQNRQWRLNFAAALDHLARDIEQGTWPAPTCPAEEMALHLALREAGSPCEDSVAEGGTDAMPSHRDDYDWGGCVDMLFEDTDILLLFDTQLESVADPELPANQDLGIGDLRPAAWFTPFHSATRHRDYSAAN